MLGDMKTNAYLPNIQENLVFVVPKLQQDGRVLALPNPRTQEPNLYVFQEDSLYEISKCEPELGSWFIDEAVKSGTHKQRLELLMPSRRWIVCDCTS